MNGTNELLTLQRAMDRLFQDTYTRWMQGSGTNGNGSSTAQYFIPAANAWESEDEVVIELALPGVNSQDVDITLEQDTLTIRGTFPERAEGKQWLLHELPRGQFQRRFTLQVPVDVDNVEATSHDGLVTLRLPKSEQVKPRKITVQAS